MYKKKVLLPTFEIASNFKIKLSDVEDGLRNGDLSGVKIFDGDKVTTFGECMSSLIEIVGKENADQTWENIQKSEEYRSKK